MRRIIMSEKAKVTPESKKSGSNTLLYIIIGIVVIIAVVGTVGSIVAGFFLRKAGVSMLQNTIEKQTGVKTNLNDLQQGKISFKDSKTGAEVNIGTDKIPDNFPKSFPIYPGSKVAGTMSGNNEGNKKGFWITLTTGDSLQKVVDFYQSKLKENGWSVKTTMQVGDSAIYEVQQNQLGGSVTIARGKSDKETSIMIGLGEKDTTTSESSSGE